MRNLAGFATAMVATFALVAIAPVVLAGVDKLKPAAGAKAADLKSYDRIVIEDLTDGVDKKLPKPDEDAKYHADVVAAGKIFADVLADKIDKSGTFKGTSRAPVEGKALLIGGRLTKYKVSNLAGRYIGFGAGSKIGAIIEVKDAQTGRLIGTIALKLGGVAIPGAINVVQTVGRFMDGGAMRVSDELLIAKGVKHREETGRQGRLREKYTH